MISVGIDVSKGKSTVCILKPYGEVINSPYEINHTETDLLNLTNTIFNFNEETKVIMEATSSYHLPLISYLIEKGIFVSVINPLVMKKYVSMTLRKGKTDKLDSAKIANYGIDN
ncbi:IS110 family transposase [Metaclostridioides mangenotii]|uniref:Transposase n=1 Tax=Metaclostridioides mangenotii TaxID=1540 RepID=A0ABS4E902_9FIRM|nr:transposase [Clostridioides mangenotii]